MHRLLLNIQATPPTIKTLESLMAYIVISVQRDYTRSLIDRANEAKELSPNSVSRKKSGIVQMG